MREIIILSMRYCTFPSQKPLFWQLLKECFLFLSLFLPFPLPFSWLCKLDKGQIFPLSKVYITKFHLLSTFSIKKKIFYVLSMVTPKISYGIENSFPWLTDSIQIYITIKTKYQSLNLGDRKELSWYHLSKFYWNMLNGFLKVYLIIVCV